MLQAKNLQPFSQLTKEVKALYQEAFPEDERFPFALLQLQSLRSSWEFVAYQDGDQLVGFSFVVTNDCYAFVLYLAVNSGARGRGYGGQILSRLKRFYAEKEMVLNIEPLDDQTDNQTQRQKRLAFYEKNGLALTGYQMTTDKQTFAIMSQSGQLNVAKYQEVLKNLSLGLATPKITKL